METPSRADDREHPYNNLTFYGATKIAGEHMLRALHHRYRNTDRRFDYVGLRYMNVYGPRQDYRGCLRTVFMKILDRLDVAGLRSSTETEARPTTSSTWGTARAPTWLAMKADVTDSSTTWAPGSRRRSGTWPRCSSTITGSKLDVQYEPAGTTFVKNRIGSPRKAEAELGFHAETALADGLRSWSNGGTATSRLWPRGGRRRGSPSTDRCADCLAC
jgi:UDP-glucose 4-epimerase